MYGRQRKISSKILHKTPNTTIFLRKMTGQPNTTDFTDPNITHTDHKPQENKSQPFARKNIPIQSTSNSIAIRYKKTYKLGLKLYIEKTIINTTEPSNALNTHIIYPNPFRAKS